MTARDLSAGVETAIQAGVVYPALLYEGEFYSAGSPSVQYLRLWTGVGTLTWDSKTWTGGGTLLGISPLEETRDVKAVGFTVTVSGIESAKVSLALQSVRQNKPGTLWLACFNAAGALIADPYRLRDGRFDIAVIEDNGETCTIAAQYEDRTIDLDRARDRRYTHEDQQIDYPGDLGFEYVAALQDMQIMWGGAAAGTSLLASPSVPVGAVQGVADAVGAGVISSSQAAAVAGLSADQQQAYLSSIASGASHDAALQAANPPSAAEYHEPSGPTDD